MSKTVDQPANVAEPQPAREALKQRIEEADKKIKRWKKSIAAVQEADEKIAEMYESELGIKKKKKIKTHWMQIRERHLTAKGEKIDGDEMNIQLSRWQDRFDRDFETLRETELNKLNRRLQNSINLVFGAKVLTVHKTGVAWTDGLRDERNFAFRGCKCIVHDNLEENLEVMNKVRDGMLTKENCLIKEKKKLTKKVPGQSNSSSSSATSTKSTSSNFLKDIQSYKKKIASLCQTLRLVAELVEQEYLRLEYEELGDSPIESAREDPSQGVEIILDHNESQLADTVAEIRRNVLLFTNAGQSRIPEDLAQTRFLFDCYRASFSAIDKINHKQAFGIDMDSSLEAADDKGFFTSVSGASQATILGKSEKLERMQNALQQLGNKSDDELFNGEDEMSKALAEGRISWEDYIKTLDAIDLGDLPPECQANFRQLLMAAKVTAQFNQTFAKVQNLKPKKAEKLVRRMLPGMLKQVRDVKPNALKLDQDFHFQLQAQVKQKAGSDFREVINSTLAGPGPPNWSTKDAFEDSAQNQVKQKAESDSDGDSEASTRAPYRVSRRSLVGP